MPCALSHLLLPTLSLVVNLLHQPFATDTRHIRPADKIVDSFTFHFGESVLVARSPVPDQDENHKIVTIHIAGQAQTPIRRRVKAVHKTNYEDVTGQMKEEYGPCSKTRMVATKHNTGARCGGIDATIRLIHFR